MNKERAQDHWLELRDRGLVLALVVTSAFLIYSRTLAPGILPGDSGEFQFAAWGWSLVHPTGYPLYLLLGGLWQHLLPLGDPAFRLNLLSALFAALTAGLAYRVFFRVTRQRGAAVVGALAFTVSPTFWGQATRAEVYALNTFLVALLTWLALKWQNCRDFKYAAGWFFTFGLALAHHRSIILLVPGFAAFFADALLARGQSLVRAAAAWRSAGSEHAVRPGFLSRRELACAALLALPLLLYAYIPLRAGATPYARIVVPNLPPIVTFEDGPAGWLSQVSGSAFGSELKLDHDSLDSLQSLPERLIREFNPLGAACGLLGLVILLYRRRMAVAALSVFGFAAVVLFDAAYHIGDISDFYTPAFFFFALWLAAGAAGLLATSRKLAHTRASLLPLITMLVLLAALPLQNLYTNFTSQDLSLDVGSEGRWRTILNSNLPEGSILLSNDRDEMTPMWYLQIVEGRRSDLVGLFPLISPDPAFSNVMRLVDWAARSGRPVLLIKDLPELGLRYDLEPAQAGLFRVSPAAARPQFPSSAVVDDKLRVTGFGLPGGPILPGTESRVAVYWQPLSPLGQDYTTSLQILDGSGRKVAQGDDHKPGGDVYPSSQWRQGETVRDQFALKLPVELEPGVYHLSVRVYVGGTDDALGEPTEIGTIQVQ